MPLHPEWKDTDLAYMAGLIDGEGTIFIYIDNRGREHRILNIGNTNRELLEWVESVFGGRVCRGSIPKKDNWAQGYLWQCGPLVADNILRACFKYLKIKQKQAAILIAYNLLRGKYGNHGIPPEMVEWRTGLMKEIRVLNGRKKTA